MELKILPVFQVIIAIAIMWLLTAIFPHVSYNIVGARTGAILVFTIALFIGLSAIISFRRHQTTVNPIKPETASKVVNTGIYAYSRNPMYLGMLLLLVALSLYLGNFIAFLVLPVFVWYITKYQIKPEEKALQRLFGSEYQTYMDNVRRWI
ncbi:isoprenylcysteine carboxylmethyltransferase family protein [Colwelliaceae bacterium 6471]